MAEEPNVNALTQQAATLFRRAIERPVIHTVGHPAEGPRYLRIVGRGLSLVVEQASNGRMVYHVNVDGALQESGTVGPESAEDATSRHGVIPEGSDWQVPVLTARRWDALSEADQATIWQILSRRGEPSRGASTHPLGCPCGAHPNKPW